MKNLTKILVLILSGLFLIVIFQFCENSAGTEIQDDEFVNPFEFVGDIHNEGLAFVIKNADLKKGNNLTIQDVCGLTSMFMISNTNYNFLNYDSEKYKELGEKLSVNLLERKMDPTASRLLQEGTKENQYLIKIRSVFNSINFNDTIASFKRIMKLEKEIWASAITEKEKDILLIMSAVGKHSFSYWKRNLTEFKDYSGSKNDKDWQTIKIELLQADMEGALCGLIAGGIYGGIVGSALLPGVGTITAAIVEGVQGASYGAVINSCWTAFKIFVLD
jgi:hypothetical protein